MALDIQYVDSSVKWPLHHSVYRLCSILADT